MKKLLNSSMSLTLCMALVAPGLFPTFANAQSNELAACGTLEVQEVFPCIVEDETVIEAPEALKEYFAAQTNDVENTEPAASETQEAPPEDAEKAEVAEGDELQSQEVMPPVDQTEMEAATSVATTEVEPSEGQQEAEADQTFVGESTPVEDSGQSETGEMPVEANNAEPVVQPEASQPSAQAANATQTEADDTAQQTENEKALAADQQDTDGNAAVSETEAETNTEAAAEPDVSETAEAVRETEAEPEASEDEQLLDEKEQAALDAEREAERTAQRQAAQEAALKALEEEPAGEVITEEVTTEDTRRSDEDFETSATGAAKEAKKDSGLSNFEKALLVGIGAAVVGTVLKNGDKVISNSGDRVIVQDEGGQLRVLKDDDSLLRRPGDQVRTEQFNDGSTRQTVEKSNGSKIITLRGGDGTVLRRISIAANGDQTVLFDDLTVEREIVISELPQTQQTSRAATEIDENELRAALVAQQRAGQDRSFSLRQIREVGQVRALAPPIELDAARFASGSAAIAPDQARNLSRVGNTMRNLIADDPRTVFLIEGHTDAVGDASYNLALSDRRAETIALAMTEYFDVPPENMITQGYGESALKVRTVLAEQANRRAVVRNITELLRQASN